MTRLVAELPLDTVCPEGAVHPLWQPVPQKLREISIFFETSMRGEMSLLLCSSTKSVPAK